ncbi:MAG: EamA family transporter [Ktedonobacterales bacterium]
MNNDIVRLRRASEAIAPPHARAGSTGTVPPSMLLFFGMLAVQLGAALAKELFSALGPAGMVFLRVGLAALMLLAYWRPWNRSVQVGAGRVGVLAGAGRADYLAVVLFGLVVAVMNFAFYSALTRIPLGIAVTVEFVGPLGVAIAGSRRALDLLWVVLAVGGILLLAPLGTMGAGRLDPLGLLLALGAGACWATYILLSARVGRAFPGGNGAFPGNGGRRGVSATGGDRGCGARAARSAPPGVSLRCCTALLGCAVLAGDRRAATHVRRGIRHLHEPGARDCGARRLARAARGTGFARYRRSRARHGGCHRRGSLGCARTLIDLAWSLTPTPIPQGRKARRVAVPNYPYASCGM